MKEMYCVSVRVLEELARILPDVANSIAIADFLWRIIDALRKQAEERRNFERLRLRDRLPLIVI